MIQFKDEYREFRKVIELYEKATRHDFVTVVNRAAVNVAIKAMDKKNMPKVERSKFTPNNPNLKRIKKYSNRLHYALLAKKGVVPGEGIKEKANKQYKKAIQSSGFLRALFIKIRQDLGDRRGGKVQPGGEASKSKGKKATPKKLVAYLETGDMNEIQMQIVSRVYRKALRLAAADMRGYAEKEMAKTAAKYSAK